MDMEKTHSVDVVTTDDGFDRLESGWNRVLDRCRSASIFMTFEWLRSWWAIFGAGKDLFVLVARASDGEVRGIWPLYRSCEGWGGVGRVVLRPVGDDQVGSAYLDIIVSEGDRPAAVRAFATYLQTRRSEWDVAFISDLRADGETLAMLCAATEAIGAVVTQRPGHVCPYLTPPPGQERVEQLVSTHTAETWRRRQRRLSQRAKVEFAAAADGATVDRWLGVLLEFHRMQFGQRGETSRFDHPLVQAFHRQVAARFLGRDRLRFFALLADGEPIALDYAMAYRETFYLYQTGFHPNWGEFSPGAAVIAHAVQSALDERRYREIDFLRGEGGYKMSWTKASRSTVTLAVGSPSLRGRVWMESLRLVWGAKTGVKRVLRPTAGWWSVSRRSLLTRFAP